MHMKEYISTHKALVISLSALLVIIVGVLGYWYYLVLSVPQFVSERYDEFASDTHTNTSLAYCLGGEQKLYRMKVDYAKENVEPGYSTGLVQYFTDNDYVYDEQGDGVAVQDLEADGSIPASDSSWCVPLRWEWGSPQP